MSEPAGDGKVAPGDHSNQANQEQSASVNSEPFGWGAFSFGIIVGVLLVYFVAVRPAKENISTLELKISRFDQTLQQLVDVRKTTTQTNTLLSSLNEQAQLVEQASLAFEQNKELNARLVTENPNTNRAHMSLSRFVRMSDELSRHLEQVDASLTALSNIEHVQDTLINQSHNSSDTFAALTQMEILRTKVLDMQLELSEAEVTLDRISSLHGLVIDQYEPALAAEATVNQWLNLQEQVVQSGAEMSSVNRSITDLIRLKDKTLLHADEARQADLVLDNILEMPSSVMEYAANVDLAGANQTLRQMTKLIDKTIEQKGAARYADLVLDNIIEINNDLAGAGSQSERARMVVNEMIMIESDLVAQAADTDEAYCNLHDLLAIRNQLDSETGQLQRANKALHELVQLKDELLLEVPSVAKQPKKNSFGISNEIKRVISESSLMLSLGYAELKGIVGHVISLDQPIVAEVPEQDTTQTR